MLSMFDYLNMIYTMPQSLDCSHESDDERTFQCVTPVRMAAVLAVLLIKLSLRSSIYRYIENLRVVQHKKSKRACPLKKKGKGLSVPEHKLKSSYHAVY